LTQGATRWCRQPGRASGAERNPRAAQPLQHDDATDVVVWRVRAADPTDFIDATAEGAQLRNMACNEGIDAGEI
jgi:hypothetical protein